jgi:hypothetical protein
VATNPIDFVIPLMERMHGLASALGTDVASVSKEPYDLVVLNTLISATILQIIQQLAPTVATDAAIAAAFDNALNLLPGQSWDDVVKRIALLGDDPDTNEWVR